MSVSCHVTKQKSNYDLILGREILRELGIKLDFSNNTTNWKDVSIPMKPAHSSTKIILQLVTLVELHLKLRELRKF